MVFLHSVFGVGDDQGSRNVIHQDIRSAFLLPGTVLKVHPSSVPPKQEKSELGLLWAIEAAITRIAFLASMGSGAVVL